jgi:hypothetical protein
MGPETDSQAGGPSAGCRCGAMRGAVAAGEHSDLGIEPMGPHRFRGGEPVIYRMWKHSVRPGPRARGVLPAPKGEDYAYYVEKFWTVVEELPNGTLVVLTRRGKYHVVRRDDPRLRRPSVWERLWFGSRFPRFAAVPAPAPPHALR